MATLQKIVLAIASSWNNGIASPAPQGNRALSNQTNALAERQEQPSAKTPPPPNRIGKGIGKFWIPILLATATVLTTIQIDAATTWGDRPLSDRNKQITPIRNQPTASPTNSPRQNVAPPPRPTYTPSTNRVSRPPTRTTRTNTVQTPNRARTPVPTRRTIPSRTVVPTSQTVQPAAVPPPLLAAPAAPVIKKGVLAVGTYLVAAVGEWFIGRQMDKLTKADWDAAEGQTATCGVESILWEGNSTKVTTRAIAGFSNMWGLLAGQSATLSVSQGQQDTPASGAEQSPTIGRRTLTSAQADSHLYHARGTIVMSPMS